MYIYTAQTNFEFLIPPPCGKGWTYQLWQWLMNLCNMLFFVCSTKKKKIAWCPATFLLHSQLFNRGPCFSLNFAWIPSVCVCVEWDLGVGFKLKSWAQSNLDPAFLLYCFLSQFEFPIFAASAFFFFFSFALKLLV